MKCPLSTKGTAPIIIKINLYQNTQIFLHFQDNPGASERKELFVKGKNLWEGDDEDEPILDSTQNVSNYRERKVEILNQQDEQLDNLAKVISRQKNIAIRIGEEVETHNGKS